MFDVHRKGRAKMAIALTWSAEDEDLPGPPWVFMMQDGGCIAGGIAPALLYFPSWESLEHFTGADLGNYEGLPPPCEEFDIDSTEYGPMVF